MIKKGPPIFKSCDSWRQVQMLRHINFWQTKGKNNFRQSLCELGRIFLHLLETFVGKVRPFRFCWRDSSAALLFFLLWETTTQTPPLTILCNIMFAFTRQKQPVAVKISKIEPRYHHRLMLITFNLNRVQFKNSVDRVHFKFWRAPLNPPGHRI